MNSDTVYHFVGIKGTGMAAMALILHDRGEKVQGSDIDQYTFTQRGLEQAGIKILPFDVNNIHEGLTVIAGNSFTDDHPEIKKAREMGLTVYRYHQFLGKIIKGKTSIGVSGAHGKTSTTGLLAHVLSGIAPTDYLIGDGSGKGVPNARFFVYEADEYRRHFLATEPDYAIMTNIDFDHPDYYKSIDDVQDAFQTFANQTKKGIFAWGDDKRLRELKANVPIYYYGLHDTDDFQAVDVKRTTSGSSFDVTYKGKNLGNFSVPLFGEHNIFNSLAVIAVAYFEDVDLDEIRKELQTFQGVKRRFAERTIAGMTIIDDYAHHPTEIKATIDAARQEYPSKKIAVVFQPHTFSRTIALMDDFAKSLNLADEVFLTSIYSSPRESHGKVSSEDLAKKITKGGRILSVDNMSPLLDYDNDVVIFMGAGDIQKYEKSYEDLLSHLTKKIN
ncbi:UDP-N-acetylmuramate--L-alanine ligase [Lentilactobacillus parabuchneri]|jgi:UDP-N-acetylmuramate--alanine ligase|uniref:UDP-N-acetylmuramate--L-alanine ligase n=6 Tax=Lentilactobacillus TaxID=2767893 RepID=A0A1X1FBC1_9LACO|nr:UDP-N-acetylmuramate--L-alanine ligase [Lentilactobacillus parabuchneri]APR08382.1 UDP-N-acetylmuramate--L-alanine ligase [Lentilactobacillus parabuchneri]KRM47955.1 UDP-N-acetylmuramate--L-alanine ligase [Lentilactobacillus parabuchneri DSM 5707 = NBRC 107865]KRN74576.1 UDP-N-acetylmuramate--L-alanine ligase [Lentilactobacillus parabuchneri]MBW0222031.1 UDP-N-acetylmuramate--L-alanine ligase [Lentilactobacillus parabuchneri]MBW0244745.1 UDP-N-acetylmuramate--L-alanine ligase [Lentilactobac